ncbi:MAG: hypothetical protein JO166_22230 [Deltaproteobacteria bacterium]|nr:hypothetical protein [Deltaproteobacteria bacterium]
MTDNLRRTTRLLSVVLFFALLLDALLFAGFYRDERLLWDGSAAIRQCRLMVEHFMSQDDTCHAKRRIHI